MVISSFKQENRNVIIPDGISGHDLLPEGTQTGYIVSSSINPETNQREDHKLCFGYYVPPNAVGAVNIEIGTCEYLEKYADSFHENADKGRATFLMERYGHGLSERKYDDSRKMSGKDFHRLAEDSYKFTTDVVRPVMAAHGLERAPITSMAVSQGAAVVAIMFNEHPDAGDNIIFGSPMWLQPDMVRLYKNLEKRPDVTKAFLTKKYGVSNPEDVIPSAFERDNEAYISDTTITEVSALWHRANPHLRANRATMDFVQHGGAACVEIDTPEFSKSFNTPSLIIIAEKWLGVKKRWGDECVDNAAAQRFNDNAPYTSIETIKGSAHDVLKDKPEHRELALDLGDQFMKSPLTFTAGVNSLEDPMLLHNAPMRKPITKIFARVTPFKTPKPVATATEKILPSTIHSSEIFTPSSPAIVPPSKSAHPTPELSSV